jgi:hypothetical protein
LGLAQGLIYILKKDNLFGNVFKFLRILIEGLNQRLHFYYLILELKIEIMKKLVSISLLLLLLVATFNSCKESFEDQLVQSQVEFSFSSDKLKAGSSQGLASVVVTIEDLQGNVVKNSEKIDIYNMNGDYISKPISLVAGDYKLTRFLVLNQNNDVVYASPMLGSPKANLVQTPLPLMFSASEDQVSKIIPEVISTAQSVPGDFGYSTFSFEVAGTFDFLLGVFAYNPGSRNYELTNASISIYSDSILVFSDDYEADTVINNGQIYDSIGITKKISLPEKYENYNIVVSKTGYITYSQVITKEELRMYFRKEDKGPLVVKLDNKCSLSAGAAKILVNPSTIEWPNNSVSIQNQSITNADFYFFDFGDSTSSLLINYEPTITHEYFKPGTYTIKLTISKNGCFAIDEQEIEISANGGGGCVANAGVDQIVSVDHAFLSAQAAPEGSTGQWLIISGSGMIANPSSPNSQVVNLGSGANSFRWLVSSDTCSSYDDITIIYNDVYADAGINAVICSDSYTLSANDPSPGTGFWSLLSGSATFENPNSPTTQVTGLSSGDNIFRWTLTLNSNSVYDDVTITNYKVFANAGADMVISDTSACTLSSARPTIGNGTWTCSGYGVTISPITNDGFNSYAVASYIPVGTTIFTWTVTNGICLDLDYLQVTRVAKK